jgi:streptogramin lyase
MKRFRLLVFALLASAAAGAAPIRNITFTAFPLGNPATYTVTAIAADPSGTRVWFTDQNFVQIGFIELATGAVTTYSVRPPTGESVLTIGGTQSLTFGADGNLWFPALFNTPTSFGSMIGRFSPATGTVTYFPTPGLALGTIVQIAQGPDGNVWFTGTTDSKLGKITPAGVVTAVPIAAANGAFASNMKGLAFMDGKVWVTSGARSIFAVPLGGGTATEYRLQGGSFRTPSGITNGPDGHLYFTESGLTADLGNRIGRITRTGVITEWDIPTADSRPTGIATGTDGKIYFTEQSTKQIGQLDPVTGVILESPVPDGDVPIAIEALRSAAPSWRAGPGVEAESRRTGIVFYALPSNFRDGRAIWAVIDPGDMAPDPEAWVDLIDSPLFPSDPDSVEAFRIGSAFYLLIGAKNVSENSPTFGELELKTTLPAFVTTASGGFLSAPGTCKAEGRVITCTTTKVLEAGESLAALLAFEVPRPPRGIETVSFTINNAISGGGDVNTTNNFDGEVVVFVVDRDAGELVRIEGLPLAILTGRRGF